MKTKDKTNRPSNRYNFTGWGNKLNAIANSQELKASVKETAKAHGVAQSTAWRTHKLRSRAHASIIGTVGDYDTGFRMRAARFAVENRSARTAAAVFGCSKGSIYNWLKAYDMTHLYFST